MKVWQLQEAKAKLTQLINESKKEPQIISRHGKYETVVMSYQKFEELVGSSETVYSFFRNSPLYGCDIEFDREPSKFRDLDL